MNWKKLQVWVLAIAFGGSLIVLGKSVVDPSIGRHSTFTFPEETLAISDGKKIAVTQLIDLGPVVSLANYTVGKRYQYTYNNLPLDIEMRYMAGTNGDVPASIQNYTLIGLPSSDLTRNIHYLENIGFYTFFLARDRAYLSTCLNPQGESTVTHEQFARNLNASALQPGRIIPWLLGQLDLRDRRCLWVHMSVPLDNNTSPEVARKQLESFWISWYGWWKDRFPRL